MSHRITKDKNFNNTIITTSNKIPIYEDISSNPPVIKENEIYTYKTNVIVYFSCLIIN